MKKCKYFCDICGKEFIPKGNKIIIDGESKQYLCDECMNKVKKALE